ncbi:hypothetical protein LUX09_32185 [Streptomyces albogriseolus]|nr:hypothetical protein [Streptomyces albogriseolus]
MALLEELRTLLERHARPDGTTPVDGVHVSRIDRQDPRDRPCPARSSPSSPRAPNVSPSATGSTSTVRAST